MNIQFIITIILIIISLLYHYNITVVSVMSLLVAVISPWNQLKKKNMFGIWHNQQTVRCQVFVVEARNFDMNTDFDVAPLLVTWPDLGLKSGGIWRFPKSWGILKIGGFNTKIV